MLKNDETRRSEHQAVRNHVGYYDFTHELVDARGLEAGKFLDKIFTNDVSGTEIGGSVYTTMLDENGAIIDDLIIFRLEEDYYWISTLEADFMMNWLDRHHEEEDVIYQDIKDKVSMYAVQGPDSRELMNRVLDHPIDDLPWFEIEKNTIDGWDVWIARAGFTGELGYEVYLDANYTEALAKILEDKGEDLKVMELTTDVTLKSLPVEKGYVLMSDIGELTPHQAGMGWQLDKDSEFIGKLAVIDKKQAEDEDGQPKYRLRGYKLLTDDTEMEEGSTIFFEEEEIGRTTSFTYGYTVEAYIGFALVDTKKADIGDKVTIQSGDDSVEAELTERIFYNKDHERIKA